MAARADAVPTGSTPVAPGRGAVRREQPEGAQLEERHAGPPLEGRGRTIIEDRVLETLAARTALDVPGVVRHTPGPDVLSAFNDTLPAASAESAGDRVRLRMRVAVDWDSEVRDVAGQVRTTVRERLARSTGKVIDRVDVTVAALVVGSQGAGRVQ